VSLKKFLAKYIDDLYRHERALGSRFPRTKEVPDPDPTSIASDMIEVPTALGKYLKKTATNRTKSMNRFQKQYDIENPDQYDLVENAGQKAGRVFHF